MNARIQTLSRVSAVVAIATALTVGASAAAAASVCVPQDAWTETVEHPAVGEPTIRIDNPDYMPGTDAVPAWDETVTEAWDEEVVIAPAWEETVTVTEAWDEKVIDVPAQPAVTHIEWKYSKHGGQGFIWVPNDTFKYVDADGNGTNQKPKHGVYYERTQNTRCVIDREAVEEQSHIVHHPEVTKVIQHPAVTETRHHDAVIVHHDEIPAVPAKGEPTITVGNPEYVPAWTETIEHDAVVCPTPEPSVTPTEPTVTPVIGTAVTPDTEQAARTELAETGTSLWSIAAGIGLVAAFLGSGVFLIMARGATFTRRNGR